jgi:hypothetical protein
LCRGNCCNYYITNPGFVKILEYHKWDTGNLTDDREIRCLKIGRSRNILSHELASFGRIHDRTIVWLGHV